MLTTTTSTILRRASSRLPSVASVRYYSQKDAFADKEKAAEDRYIREQEKEKLQQLKDQLSKLQKDVQSLESQLGDKN